MRQVVQAVSGGPVRVIEVPRPVIGPTEVLVQTMHSVISPGTERAVTALAQGGLLAKARARPDLVPASDAAFATVASVALHGLRLAEVEPGARVVVIGLGLVGQLAVRLARAAGCEVAAIDLQEFVVDRAKAAGAFALLEEGDA